LRIIGGLKTYDLPGGKPNDKRPYDFTDAGGWRALAEEAREVSRLTGSREVLMENEWSLKPFHEGTASIDFQKLGRSLTVLRDTDLQFWWWLPSILTETPQMRTRQAQTQELVRTVAEAVPDSVFLTVYAGWYDWERSEDTMALRRLMIDTVRPERMRDMLYLTPDGFVHLSAIRKRRCYTVAEAIRQVATLQGEVVLYPGAANWVTVAQEYVRLSPNRPTGPP
jgi:hypothetical protein